MSPGTADDGAREGCDILLAAEAAADIELTLRALALEGVPGRAVPARDGEEVLDLLLGRSGATPLAPRVVLLDRKLPKLDGVEVLRQLRQDVRTRAVPVVVFVGGAEEDVVRRCYQFGASSCVVKPVDFERFRETVGRIGAYWLRTNVVPRPESPR
jgi:CheY-like chemotaxis protein